ncbi:MAG: 1-phosphofructokinase family hexose kinase [Bacillota bacterium]
MKDVQILNLNPSLDHTGILKKPLTGDVVRVEEVVPLASGKGIDVARVLKTLGYDHYVVANILGGGVGRLIKENLDEENINYWNYWIKGDSRINYALVREAEDRTLMINEQGPRISPYEKEEFLNELFDWFKEGQIMVLAGSATIGFDQSDIAAIVRQAREKEMYIAIDSSKSYLKACLQEDFDLLKINDQEFINAFKNKYDYLFEDKRDFIRVIEQEGLERAIITFGKEGSLLYHKGQAVFGHNQKVFSSYAIGSGDSFLAGYIYGFVNDYTETEALKLAMACGAANTRQYGAGKISCDHVEEIRDNYLEIEKLDI